MNTNRAEFAVARTGADGTNQFGRSVEEIPLVRQYLRILLRWKKVIGATVLGFVILGLIITFLMTPQYTATATIEIARESNKVVNIQSVEQEASAADLEFYQTQYGLLRSHALAERVVSELKLADDPTFFETLGITLKGDAAQMGPSGKFSALGRKQRTRAASDTLLRKVAVNPVRLSRLVNVGFTSPEPELSARVVNAWTANFITSTLERRFDATSYARKFLEGRLEQVRQRLEQSERLLVAYASAQKIINLPGGTMVGSTNAERSIVADDLAILNAELGQATGDRIKAQSRARGADGSTPEALQNLAIQGLRQKRAEQSADYQKLLAQFEPDYPVAKALKSQIDQLDSSISREESRVAQSLRNAYQENRVRETQLERGVDRLKTQLLDLRRRSIQYNIYQRDVDTNRQLYDGLLQRYKEIGVAGGIGTNNISVVDSAEIPVRPSSPRLLVNLVLAIAAGLLASAAVAYALEQSDEAISDPANVERALQVPLLGSVPLLDGRSPEDALLDRKSELVEAYLSVQTSLRFATDHGIPYSLSVTSTRPSEGKSTTAFALATVLARSAKRVLLIDGDMRSPSVHSTVGHGNERGLSDYLAGNEAIGELIAVAPDFGISVMPSGPLPPNAAELLTGDRLKSLIELLRDRFDHIIVDSPPVMGLADALLIGSRVEGVVFAIESHGIRTSLVRVALGRLDAANTKILGAVVTKFESKKAHFGYGYDYGYGYGNREHARG